MPKHLKIRAKLSQDKKKVHVEILEQTIRGRGFGTHENNTPWERRSEFTHDRVVLRSFHEADYVPHTYWSDYYGRREDSILYVNMRPGSRWSTRKKITMTPNKFRLFREAVKAYNEWGAKQP